MRDCEYCDAWEQSVARLANEVENLKVQNHRLYEALEQIEGTNEKIKDWSEECAARRVRAENKWRELALENAQLRNQITPGCE